MCCGVRCGKDKNGRTIFFFFEIKTMIVLPKTLSNYVTRKEINECANGNTWVLGG